MEKDKEGVAAHPSHHVPARIEDGVSCSEVKANQDLKKEDDKPSFSIPRKRLMNFKIPLLGGQRRDQQLQQSVVARRRVVKGDRGERGQKKITTLINLTIIVLFYYCYL